jgi:RNA polymerase primary sigma factor
MKLEKNKNTKLFKKLQNLNLPGEQKATLEELMFRPVAFMTDPRFRRPKLMESVMAEKIQVITSQSLKPAQEQVLFLQMNYARHKMCQVRRRLLQSRTWKPGDIKELLDWNLRQQYARSQIINANMGLVLSMAKKIDSNGIEFTDLISEGSMALLRATEKFDASRGFKFSTYACRAVLKSFSRVAKQSYRYHRFFPAQLDVTLEKDDFRERRRVEEHDGLVDEVRLIVRNNLAELSDIEQKIVTLRFPLGQESEKSLTLKEVGDRLGLTKERIRQIQNKALAKLRLAAEERLF